MFLCEPLKALLGTLCACQSRSFHLDIPWCGGSEQGSPVTVPWPGDANTQRLGNPLALTHLSSIRTQRSLNCLGRWCLLCLLCHFFCRPNSSSWLRLSGSKRCGDRAGSSSSGVAVGVTEGASGMAAAGVAGAGLAEISSGGGAELLAAELERGTACEHVVHVQQGM